MNQRGRKKIPKMKRLFTPFTVRTHRKSPGLPPGSLVHEGERKAEEVEITVHDYTETTVKEREIDNVRECSSYKDSQSVTWININGLHEVGILEEIGEQYGLHPLVMEDILSTRQRPKMEDYESYLYLVIRMITYDPDHESIQDEQVSILLGKNFVLSFQEQPGDVFDPIRKRLRNPDSRLRKHGPDYLAYALMDAIVDHYFVSLEQVGERIIGLEESLMQDVENVELDQIHHLKREMIYLRKSIWPLREVISQLNRGESTLFNKKTLVFLRDVYDHTIQVVDTIESYRDMISSLLDLYMSTLSNRMNEVMKVLTIIATIFIPLTFIAGIYGMNFEHMPELGWKWSYPIIWSIMLVVGGIMLLYFRRKKWL